jgi:hypothetical protein
LLLVPLVVLFSPLMFIACLICHVNPFRMFSVGWQILSALKSTKVTGAARGGFSLHSVGKI